ncbi:hypothetical protein AAFF_G00259450 [Aldrovandia affinis]|uniref:F5/8 type C domain-containing protein n=1 Tax=Aldrovandia affinis TaxID=143900 RepID=A0AAD7RCE2_9TELE|nr:hypothetical protein AAFF_G00259450 [Aldrovandia affinis]
MLYQEYRAKFLGAPIDRIGRRYKKAVFTQYTDEKFTVREESRQRKMETGILGPVIRAQIRDVVKTVISTIVFKNMASRPYSIYPHGLTIKKSDEGASYPAGGNQTGAVQPGQTHTYVWEVWEQDEPTPADSRCLTRMYHSAVDPVRDIASGLVGPLLICKSQSLNKKNVQLKADKEQQAALAVFDENRSWYIEENIRSYCSDPARVRRDDPDFYNSNVMHSINGYVFDSGQVLGFCNGEIVTWHLSSVGAQDHVQTATFYGHSFELNDRTEDIVSLFPMTGRPSPWAWTTSATGSWHRHWLLASLSSYGASKGVRLKFKDLECYRDYYEDYNPDGGGGSRTEADDRLSVNAWRPEDIEAIRQEERDAREKEAREEEERRTTKNAESEEDIEDYSERWAAELGLRTFRNESGGAGDEVELLDLGMFDYGDGEPANGISLVFFFSSSSSSRCRRLAATPKPNITSEDIQSPDIGASAPNQTSPCQPNTTSSARTHRGSGAPNPMGSSPSRNNRENATTTTAAAEESGKRESAIEVKSFTYAVLLSKPSPSSSSSSDDANGDGREDGDFIISPDDEGQQTGETAGDSAGCSEEAKVAGLESDSDRVVDVDRNVSLKTSIERGNHSLSSDAASHARNRTVPGVQSGDETSSPDVEGREDGGEFVSPENATSAASESDDVHAGERRRAFELLEDDDAKVAGPDVGSDNDRSVVVVDNRNASLETGIERGNCSVSSDARRNRTVPETWSDNETSPSPEARLEDATTSAPSFERSGDSSDSTVDNLPSAVLAGQKRFRFVVARADEPHVFVGSTRQHEEDEEDEEEEEERQEEVAIYLKNNSREAIVTVSLDKGKQHWGYEGVHLLVPLELPDHMTKYTESEAGSKTEEEEKMPAASRVMKTRKRKVYKPNDDAGGISPRGRRPPLLRPRSARGSRPITSEEDLSTKSIVIGVPRRDFNDYELRGRRGPNINDKPTEFTKVVFRSYLDSSFNTRNVRGEVDEHLGILGPIINNEVDQTILVVFKNLASRPYSLHAHGVSYSKQMEGLKYDDVSPHWYKLDNEVRTNATYTYIWKVEPKFGPKALNSACRTWAYYSGKGTLANEETALDMREFTLLFMTFDETKSWYYEDNLERIQRKHRRRPRTPVHPEHPVPHDQWYNIQPERVEDVHEPAGGFATLEMRPSRPGLWQLETEAGSLQQRGMQTLFLVIDNSCGHALGLKSQSVKDNQITASHHTGEWKPHLARLGNRGRYNAWSTDKPNGSWIQVDFQRPVVISKVSTQGAKQLLTSHYVQKYSVSYSTDKRKWTFYKGVGQRTAFTGNSDAYGTKVNTFFPPLIGRFVRLHPIESYNRPTVRMEYYGCELDGCSVPLGMESGLIGDQQITASSSCSVPLGMESGLIGDQQITASSSASSWFSGPWQPWFMLLRAVGNGEWADWGPADHGQFYCQQLVLGPWQPWFISRPAQAPAAGSIRPWQPWFARLNREGSVNAWQAKDNNMQQWLQVELRRVQKITGIVTQGARSMGTEMYVSEYALDYSKDGRVWTKYREDEDDDEVQKVFPGNTDNHGHAKNYIYPPIFSRFVRILPRRWQKSITMRIELLGCEFQ